MNFCIIILSLWSIYSDSTKVNILPSIDQSWFIQKANDYNSIINFDGLPINPSFIQIVNIGNRKYISLPILISDHNLEPKVQSRLFNPTYWYNYDHAVSFGRPSLWHLKEGQKTIYSIIIDPRQEGDIGIGLVFVKNVGNNTLIVFLKDMNGLILFATSGEFIRKDSIIGMGYIKPLEIEMQNQIQNKYQPLWNINPIDFFLFGQ